MAKPFRKAESRLASRRAAARNIDTSKKSRAAGELGSRARRLPGSLNRKKGVA